MKTLLIILSLCLCVPLQFCFANVIVVDINGNGDFDTIQAAIDISVSGDTVLVLAGTYFENINYQGKNICVMSSAGADSTTIDGSQPLDFTYRSVVTFISGEDSTAILSGFTITGGTGMYFVDGAYVERIGGGIICDMGSSPVIENNIIRDNTAACGGGLEIANSSNPIIRYNIIWQNMGSKYDATWVNAGGGIDVALNAKPIILNNTIVDNECLDGGGGVGVIFSGKPFLYNNIIVNNDGGGISAISGQAQAFYNDVWNNTPSDYVNVTNVGGISADPLFVNSDNGDFRLQPGSPCIDAGDPALPLDLDGTITDQGAFPFYHFDAPCIWLLSHQLLDENGNGRVDAGETASLIVTLKNTSLDATGLSVTLTSSDPDIQFIQPTSDFGNLAQYDSTDNQDNPLSFSIDPAAKAHISSLVLKITAEGGYKRELKINFLAGTPEVLLVDDDAGDLYETYYTDVLNRMEIFPEVWDVPTKGSPQNELQKYYSVIWFTGDCRDSTLCPDDQAAIAAYLDNGGCLLLTGQDIGYDLVEAGTADDSTFYANYLHADYLSDSSNTHRAYGVNSDPITHGLYAYFVHKYGGAENQTTPDEISPILPAVTIFDYKPNNTCAALRYENEATGSRLVYLAFGFEGIAGPYEASAGDLIDKILQWFDEATPLAVDGSEENQIPTSYRLNQNFPNPFNPETAIQYQLLEAGLVTLGVFNLLGQRVKTLVNQNQTAGIHQQVWDGRNDIGKIVPTGVYFYQLRSGNFSAMKKMLLMQ
ncbi:MAG: right-handed parallel beta-helix repeat-containing protein [Methanosarcinaceae archaeon]